LKILWLHVKICPPGGAWEEQQPQFFLFCDPLYISEANGARKLKFDVPVGLFGC